MLKKFLPLISLIPGILLGNVGPDGFHAFKNRVFVETGTFGGDGIIKAIDAGFQEIHSLEIDKAQVKNTSLRFQNHPSIHIYEKDSSYQLWDVIKDINEPITFWLDAHNGFPDPNAVGVKNTPLLDELEQIKNHPIKSHIILIDDLHCCNTLLFDYLSLNDIIEKVLEVNPNFTITFVNGGNDGEYPNNILVAFVDE